MKTLTYNEFSALNIEEPVKFTVDKEDAVNSIQRNSKKSLKWSALPLEEAIYGSHKNSLATYCTTKKIQNIYAFSNYNKHPSEILEAATSAANIQMVEGSYALRAYTVIPESGDFQIISDGDYYFIFLGDEDFFSIVLNLNLAQGIKQFAASIEKYSADRHERLHLGKILNICKNFNSKA